MSDEKINDLLDDLELAERYQESDDEAEEASDSETDTNTRRRASEVPDEAFSEAQKQPVVVEAVQMDEPFVVETMENKRGEKLYGEAGDYLIRGVDGELYPCDTSVFTQTYQEPDDCACEMRTFHLKRVEDESGTSGTGIVAEGVEFADGTVVLHWFNEDNDDLDTTSDGLSVKPGPDGVEDTRRVHGHGGRTKIVFHDA